VIIDVHILSGLSIPFVLAHNVLKRKEEMEHDQMLMKVTSGEKLEQATLTKMKSMSGAKYDVCIAMLESIGCDVKTLIEAFYMKR
jgi:hypothetical protein